MEHSEAKGVQGSLHHASREKLIAIITARGGSKGLPRKNVRLFDGKPLIVHTIQAALECPYISRCIVSTEDEEIKHISQQWGAEVIDRPVELATDTALSKDVVRHVLTKLNFNELTRYFVLLQPTSPLRTSRDLTECISMFLSKGSAKSAVSVCELDRHPYKSFTLNQGHLTSLLDEKYLDQPRQLLPQAYAHNGAIYITDTQEFLKTDHLFNKPIFPYIMSALASADIDNELDFYMAEKALEFLNRK